MIDFIYDGTCLSDYGFVLCDFDNQNTFTFTDAGIPIKFEKSSINGGKRFSLISTGHEECLTGRYDICKNPDMFEEDMSITDDEYLDIVRWLNRREFLKFQPIDESGAERDVFYNASFNIQKVELDGKLYGLRLAMETDRPYGYGTEQNISFDFDNTNAENILRDISDEIGAIYPTVIITCNAAGNLSLHNCLEDCTTIIKNCSAGEVITMDGDNQIISTSIASHKLSKDFNFEFFRIGNLSNNRDNVIQSSLPCHIEIRYNPIIKDIP